MRIKIFCIITLSIFLIFSNSLFSQDKENLTFATESGLGIQLGGQVEMEFVDVEGEGGFANKDQTVKKVKTRSPHMRIDKAIFSTKIFYSDNLSYEIQFRFDDSDAKVDKHFATLKLPAWNTKFEIGKNRPMIRTSRRTEGYPLIGTAFWKGREYHVTSKTGIEVNDDVNFNFGGSFAMKRPFDTDDVAEDKSGFTMFVYGDNKSKDEGQTFEYGFSGGFEAYGLYGQGWYFIGELMDKSDWVTLSEVPGYAEPNYFAEFDKTHYWFGGRIGFDQSGFNTRAEYIKSEDGLLPRDGYYAEASYIIDVRDIFPVQSIRPLVRYGALNVRDVNETSNTNSWDRQLTTFAFLSEINDFLNFKIEYYLVDEITGASGENKNVKDDQLLFQFEFNF